MSKLLSSFRVKQWSKINWKVPFPPELEVPIRKIDYVEWTRNGFTGVGKNNAVVTNTRNVSWLYKRSGPRTFWFDRKWQPDHRCSRFVAILFNTRHLVDGSSWPILSKLAVYFRIPRCHDLYVFFSTLWDEQKTGHNAVDECSPSYVTHDLTNKVF